MGFAFGVEISACFGGVLFACGGLLPPALLENFEEKFENQEFLRWGEAPPPVGEPVFSLGLAPDLGKLDREGGIGFGVAGLAVGPEEVMSWLLVVDRAAEDAVGAGASLGCCDSDLGRVTVFVVLSMSTHIISNCPNCPW